MPDPTGESTPNLPTFEDDDGTVQHGQAAIAAMTAWIDADPARRARWTPEQREAAARYYERLNAELDRRAAAMHLASCRPQGIASAPIATVARPRERRERHIARSTSSGDSGSGSADPEPSEEGLCDCGCNPPQLRRFCACGCRREITHRRADAKTFGAACRQRIARAAERAACRPLEPRSCQCESGFFYRDAEGDAVCGLCGCWLSKVSAPVTTFHTFDALLRSNGTYVGRRPVPREWRTARQEADPCAS